MPDEPATQISFYIVAHADDWQLFVCPQVWHDLMTSKHKVVFLITTAGDAGMDERYWRAREEGCKSSVRFCIAPFAALTQSDSVVEFNQHLVHASTINHVIIYFLRLPDGGLAGNGFALYGRQSLSKLHAGEIGAISSVDNLTTYQSWSDFYTTLQEIILAESKGIPNVWINYLNPDRSVNPNDHADHVATGHAIQATIISSVQQRLYVGYNSKNDSANLSPDNLFWKVGMFAAYEKAVFDSCGYSTLREGPPTYLDWCLKSAPFITANEVL